MRYGGLFSARGHQTKFRRALLPQGGLEISFILCIHQGSSAEKNVPVDEKLFCRVLLRAGTDFNKGRAARKRLFR